MSLIYWKVALNVNGLFWVALPIGVSSSVGSIANHLDSSQTIARSLIFFDADRDKVRVFG
jgi:hypothetical protein